MCSIIADTVKMFTVPVVRKIDFSIFYFMRLYNMFNDRRTARFNRYEENAKLKQGGIEVNCNTRDDLMLKVVDNARHSFFFMLTAKTQHEILHSLRPCCGEYVWREFIINQCQRVGGAHTILLSGIIVCECCNSYHTCQIANLIHNHFNDDDGKEEVRIELMTLKGIIKIRSAPQVPKSHSGKIISVCYR